MEVIIQYLESSIKSLSLSLILGGAFGNLFEEVTAENLLEVTFSDQLVGCQEPYINPTGYAIHSAIYQARPEVNAIFHLHTPASIAVSAQEQGLLPVSQHAYHFYERIGYFEYDSLTLHQSTQGADIAKKLIKDHPILILRNHGTLVCGKTLQEAFFYQYHLERACQVQCLLNGQNNFVMPPKKTCQKAYQDILSVEENLGERDWAAFVRKLERLKKEA